MGKNKKEKVTPPSERNSVPQAKSDNKCRGTGVVKGKTCKKCNGAGITLNQNR